MLPLFTVLLAESVVRGLGTLLADAGVVINGQTGGILLVLVFRRGHRLRPAPDRPLPRGAPAPRGQVRRNARRAATGRAGHRRLGRNRDRGIALPLPRASELDRRARPRGRDGSRGRSRRDADTPARAAPDRRPARVLAVHATRRPEAPPGTGLWGRLGRALERHRRPAWIGTTLALGVLALGTLGLDDDLSTANSFRESVESAQGQRLLSQAFPAGESAPPSSSSPTGRRSGRQWRPRAGARA